ncbi:MAG: esterase-like activity of phytase family protein [Comamonas sp.]|uniref:esterase-like activity of phytase family protein n=1 Tax=Comamonas TaxID=283 RepID=UPI0005BE29F9|nr:MULTISPECIES: esterase-like activity of phytase family protein [Comamonas]MPS89289.1 esterase-like activity of phytase family protein [Comamonas sp.]TYK70812.1 esterase-like activity of phytase family protein [Comamonas sp. Z3]
MNNPRPRWLWGLLLICASLAACTTASLAPHRICSTPQARPWSLLGEIRWPHEQLFAGTTVGGLSSIDYDAGSHLYFLVSDDRLAHGPARFYTARIDYDARGLHQVRLHDARPLLSPSQAPYASRRQPLPGIATPDAEALRVLPGGQSLIWSSEGDFARGFGPQLLQSGTDGRWQREWPLPPELRQPTRKSEGPRSNLTLEGLALSQDGETLWLAMEAALRQDGPLPAPGRAGGPVRITAYDMGTQQPRRQLAYQPDAMPADIWLQRGAINGVSAVLADDAEHLLVLERSFAPPLRFGARIYRISTRADASSDTLGQAQLQPGSYRPANKELLLDLADAGLRSVDNLEGMTWGPPLPDGRRVLLLVSDNNFNPAEVTQLIALSEEPGHCGTGL